MILIEKVKYKDIYVRFYNGIDFDFLVNYKKDGTDGFVYCFIDNWVSEVKNYNRNNKVDSIIKNKTYSDFDWDSINNNYIYVYQADGIGIDLLYKTIRDKVLNDYLPKSPYLSIADDNMSTVNSGGAWKIENVSEKN
jgi:hypothetical protein